MNAKSLAIIGLAVAALCLGTTGHLGARGITARHGATLQSGLAADTNATPGLPDTEANTNSGPGTPAPQNEPTPANPGEKSLGQGNLPAAPAGDQTQVPMPVNRASHLIGMTVKNPQNETLGKIKDVVIDLKTSRVPYVVLVKAGRNHGTGSELAVPLSHFAPSADRETLILTANKSQLQTAAGFSGDNLPSMNNPAFGAEPEPTRREIFIVPVPVRPPDQNQDDQHETIPPHMKKGPTTENP